MIGDQLGVGYDPGQHAAHVKSWVKVQKRDPREVLRASREADKITAYARTWRKNGHHRPSRSSPQVERPSMPDVARKAPTLTRARIAGGRER